MRHPLRTRIDFLRFRKVMFGISGTIILIGLGIIAFEGFNYGLDFAGGTQVRVAFRDTRDNDAIRKSLEGSGFKGPKIQTFQGSIQETLIRIESSGEEEQAKLLEAGEKDSSIATRVVGALASDEDRQSLDSGKIDINSTGRDRILDRMMEWDPDGLLSSEDEALAERARDQYGRVVDAVKELQKQNHGILTSFEQIGEAEGMTEPVLSALRLNGFLGSFAVLEVGYVGPQVGSDLRWKAILAMVFSFAGILAYIWFRFELEFGIAAICATVHDILLTLGVVAVSRIEFDLTIVAALLTIVGYSVNDTIVIFDRIRENLRAHRRADFEDLCNYSINQTLSRTVLTAVTTLFVLVSLALVGGDVTRGFALTLILGIFIGTYSSIYIASPSVILLRGFGARRRAGRKAALAS